MSEELIPVTSANDSALYPLPLPLLPAAPDSRQLAPLALPPMEPGKNVKLIILRDAAGREALFYKSTAAKDGGKVMAHERARYDERETENRGRESRGRRRSFISPSWFLLLAVLAAVGITLWSGANARTIHCALCGAEVREWTDVRMTQSFSSMLYMLENAMLGNTIPEERYEICQGCRGRFLRIMRFTQSKDFEALLRSKELEELFGGGG